MNNYKDIVSTKSVALMPDNCLETSPYMSSLHFVIVQTVSQIFQFQSLQTVQWMEGLN